MIKMLYLLVMYNIYCIYKKQIYELALKMIVVEIRVRPRRGAIKTKNESKPLLVYANSYVLDLFT